MSELGESRRRQFPMDEPVEDAIESVLERAVAAVQKAALDQRAMLWTFAASSLYIPSTTQPTSGSMMSIQPPVLTAVDGQQLLPLFTAPARAIDYVTSYPYLSVRLGLEILRHLPPDAGFVVNPSGPLGFELRPDDIVALRTEIDTSR